MAGKGEGGGWGEEVKLIPTPAFKGLRDYQFPYPCRISLFLLFYFVTSGTCETVTYLLS